MLYRSPLWLIASMFSVLIYNYDRKGPKVFAGEYACHGKGKKWNHFNAALLEAAFMTGLERNADIDQEGFYDGLTFHRIMDGFMVQGGDPLGNGTGGSDENIKGEFSNNGVENNISHTRGVISMARAMDDPDSASSQFFIVHEDSPFLDGDYAGFGHVTEGMDVVDAICKDAKPTDDNGTIKPEEQPVIESITIVD